MAGCHHLHRPLCTPFPPLSALRPGRANRRQHAKAWDRGRSGLAGADGDARARVGARRHREPRGFVSWWWVSTRRGQRQRAGTVRDRRGFVGGWADGGQLAADRASAPIEGARARRKRAELERRPTGRKHNLWLCLVEGGEPGGTARALGVLPQKVHGRCRRATSHNAALCDVPTGATPRGAPRPWAPCAPERAVVAGRAARSGAARAHEAEGAGAARDVTERPRRVGRARRGRGLVEDAAVA